MGNHMTVNALVLDEAIAVVEGKHRCSERLGHNELHLHYMVQAHRPCTG